MLERDGGPVHGGALPRSAPSDARRSTGPLVAASTPASRNPSRSYRPTTDRSSGSANRQMCDGAGCAPRPAIMWAVTALASPRPRAARTSPRCRCSRHRRAPAARRATTISPPASRTPNQRLPPGASTSRSIAAQLLDGRASSMPNSASDSPTRAQQLRVRPGAPRPASDPSAGGSPSSSITMSHVRRWPRSVELLQQAPVASRVERDDVLHRRPSRGAPAAGRPRPPRARGRRRPVDAGVVRVPDRREPAVGDHRAPPGRLHPAEQRRPARARTAAMCSGIGESRGCTCECRRGLR